MRNSTFKTKPYAELLEKKIAKQRNRPVASLKPLRRTKIRVKGHSETSVVKEEIQALLRELSILTYGSCVLSKFEGAGPCGGYNKKEELILQAEHLCTRANSSTFGDMRNIVLLCRNHHIFWKPQYSKQYWELIRRVIGERRWAWLKAVEEDRSPHKVDLKLVKLALEQDLRELKNQNV